MKKIIVLILCIVAILTTKHFSSHRQVQNSLLLYNIEALAADEGWHAVRCMNSGTLDCPVAHEKVKYIFSGYSLEDPN